MTNFVKFSDVRKKRIQLEQMAKEGMSDVKGGYVNNPYPSRYGVECEVSIYSVQS